MIYLVTREQKLIESTVYKAISVEESLKLLEPLTEVGLDTETTGLDPWTKLLKSVQLGCYEFQIVIDTFTVDIHQYKTYLESDRLFILWNAKFDLKFLFRQGIYPKKVYDGFLAEKLLYHGHPPGAHSMSLKSAGETYLGIELDKSVRGKIIWAGLEDDVIEYAALDVKYLKDIMDLQLQKLKEQELLTAIKLENKFVFPMAYMELCGIKLDEDKWKAKMAKDQAKLNKCQKELDTWLIKNMPNSKYVNWSTQGDLFEGFKEDPDITINWNSSIQLIPIFKSLGLNLETKDKEKGGTKDSIDAKVLGPQADKSDLVPIYLAFKEAAKLTSTYGQNFLDQINPVSKRIHTNYQQLGADTTRITSGGKDKASGVKYVNLLNLPSDHETRACFVAEEGNRWISIDYSGQNLPYKYIIYIKCTLNLALS